MGMVMLDRIGVVDSDTDLPLRRKMKGAFIEGIDLEIRSKLIEMGFQPINQDIYFSGTMVTSNGKLWHPLHPFKPWNPDGKGWPECQTFAEDDKEGFLKAAEELIKKENV